MVHTIPDKFTRFTSAARAMVEGDLVDASVGRYSRTIFVATDGRDSLLRTAALEAARKNDFGAVVLEFGFGSKANGPRGYTVAAMVDGSQQLVADCALWVSGPGRALLVPRDPAVDAHFTIGEEGLELRSGRPASSLAAGTVRAANRLTRLARTRKTDDACFGVKVVDLPLAA